MACSLHPPPLISTLWLSGYFPRLVVPLSGVGSNGRWVGLTLRGALWVRIDTDASMVSVGFISRVFVCNIEWGPST